MLPANITLILLSATVPNTREFADWVGRTKQKDIYVISTSKRPVPLEHHIYIDKKFFKVVDSSKNFLASGYKNAFDIANPPKKEIVRKDDSNSRGRGGSRSTQSSKPNANTKIKSGVNSQTRDKNIYGNLIELLKKDNLLPVIIFTFSKKKCEEYAKALFNLDLTAGSSQKSQIHIFFEASLSCLKVS
jgi:antiviral helicase SKI2